MRYRVLKFTCRPGATHDMPVPGYRVVHVISVTTYREGEEYEFTALCEAV